MTAAVGAAWAAADTEGVTEVLKFDNEGARVGKLKEAEGAESVRPGALSKDAPEAADNEAWATGAATAARPTAAQAGA